MTHSEIIAKMEAGQAANIGPYYTGAEAKRVLEEVRKTFPEAWATRSPSSNSVIIYPR